MANTRELRRRIRSVKNTSQITKAMQMVAATKMRRAQAQALSSRPYIESLNYALSELNGKVDPEVHPLLGGTNYSHTSQSSSNHTMSSSNSIGGSSKIDSRIRGNDKKESRNDNEGNIGMLVLSTDKGLCGALNTNLFRLIQAFVTEHGHSGGRRPIESKSQDAIASLQHDKKSNMSFFSVGKKGRQFLAKTGKELKADFENPETVSSRLARQIAKLLIDSFLSGELKEVLVIYPHFVSTLRQEPTMVKLLPIDPSSVILGRNGVTTPESDKKDSGRASLARMTGNLEFLFEPTADLLLDFILTHSVETKIYSALLETKASEHSARMIAMKNATDNAKDLVEDLTLSYNQTRQQAITNELLEITTAQAALE